MIRLQQLPAPSVARTTEPQTQARFERLPYAPPRPTPEEMITCRQAAGVGHLVTPGCYQHRPIYDDW